MNHDPEAVFHERFGERPKDSLGLCIWVGQSQGWEAGRTYERTRWREIVEGLAEHRTGAVQAVLWDLAEMLDRNLERVRVQTN